MVRLIRFQKMASIILIICCILLFPSRNVEAVIGINWGRHTSQKLVASMVVDILLQNGIRETKIFAPAINVMRAFSGSKIGVIISVSNNNLDELTPEGAGRWVSSWISDTAVQLNVDISGVHVGTEPLSLVNNGKYAAKIVDNLKNLRDALNEGGYAGIIKATVPHHHDVLKPNLTKPSDADFRDDVKEVMLALIRILKEDNAPFVVMFHPLPYVTETNMDLDFAFFDEKSKHVVVDDNGLSYTNVFDFLYDSFVWALKKAGAPELEIIVEVGWPSDGYLNADGKNAERFYKGLMPKIVKNLGTPMQPGAPLHVYIHSLADENKIPLQYGTYNRHYGIYSSDGKPKYKIDFSGQGRDVYPTTAKGVTHLPERWCVFNKNMTDKDMIRAQVDWACSQVDCTALAPGGSCSHLDFNQNISYAFNKFFQTKAQNFDEQACDFGGLGMTVPDDPSDGTCLFPVEILTAESVDHGASLLQYFNDAQQSCKISTSAKLSPFFLICLILMQHIFGVF